MRLAVSMTPPFGPDDLAAAGRGLYGTHWRGPLARALGVQERTLTRWLAGQMAIPPAVEDEVLALLARQQADRALELVEELAAEHGAAAEIVLTQGHGEVGRRATALVAQALRARGIAVRVG